MKMPANMDDNQEFIEPKDKKDDYSIYITQCLSLSGLY
jgi:hypothetical protein